MKALILKFMIIVVPCMIILSSCGTTLITVDPDSSSYSIYVNGENRGTSPAKITKRGLPKRAIVEVKDPAGNTLASQTIRRRFVFNLFTVLDLLYYPLLISNFEFEKVYDIRLPVQNGRYKSPWDLDSPSAWD